ncbi:MAG: ABC transporter permease, partial [Deltaproteobacteria bacterium]
MLRFVARRLLQMVPLLVGITFLSFVVVDLAPGDFFSTLRLNPSISPDLIRQMEVEFGYGQPLVVRYGRWVWRVLHLDLGMSIAYRVAVVDLIASRALNTVILAAASMVFSWALAIPIGTIVALRRGSVTDRALSFLSFLGMSVPSFFLAFLLMYLALETGWFPVGGTTSVDYPLLDPLDKVADRAMHLVLPVIV